ncbi:MAG: transcriptional repressor [Oscillospiraceae bacterium]|jgi:Fe2+ or Zn2+ uptake regulation protein|nr:transcriptional repressor [Oscillospiraceae bacterium]
MKNYSRQREHIIKKLASVKTHPTASEIYDMVRADLPNISLATVYRNLSSLSGAGIIQRIDAGDGTERFDADTATHYHFYCGKCRRVYDLDMPVFSDIDAIAADATGNTVERHTLILYGICKLCKSGEK